MEITSFVLGIVTVIALVMGVGMVWAVTQINKLNRSVEETWRTIWSHMDNHRNDVVQETSEINKLIDQMYRDMDSRFDKFENRISNKQLLKD